jgi:ketosteroid isomerase-like protein
VNRSPREVAELVRRMVAGDDVSFADLFARDGVLRYPFAGPGFPHELHGREEIRAFHGRASARRDLFAMAGVSLVVHETRDPEVVVLEIEHHGRSRVTGGDYRLRALGVVRVRDGEIVSYDDYMDPIAVARLLGRTDALRNALAAV